MSHHAVFSSRRLPRAVGELSVVINSLRRLGMTANESVRIYNREGTDLLNNKVNLINFKLVKNMAELVRVNMLSSGSEDMLSS